MTGYSKIFRAWINAPSSLDPWNKWHGLNVLAAYDYEGYECMVFFLEGDMISMPVPGKFLAKGWH